MSFNENDLSVEELLDSVGKTSKDNPLVWNKSIAIANAKMGMENNKLTQRTQELTEEQIKVSGRANELTEKLLLSNEQASKQSERNAELMYKATEQLAKSTHSLNCATWVLVAFTAVQALIAIASFIKK
jgi:predicted RNA methylase